ncbi:MAG TPA: VOC family protein [Gemmatimonadaceae bacterium]|nr:VOC family protein [Gemmatimonadaceae bacterium]
MLKPKRILELALYCDDLARTAAFYGRLLGSDPMVESGRLVAFDAGGGTVLLLFDRGASRQAVATPRGTVPAHDGSGPVHLALAIDVSEVGAWERQLAEWGIAIESRVAWERGGVSLYFRDPDGRSVELATQGTWPTY